METKIVNDEIWLGVNSVYYKTSTHGCLILGTGLADDSTWSILSDGVRANVLQTEQRVTQLLKDLL